MIGLLRFLVALWAVSAIVLALILAGDAHKAGDGHLGRMADICLGVGGVLVVVWWAMT